VQRPVSLALLLTAGALLALLVAPSVRGGRERIFQADTD
jgi:hypothetical protein